MSKIIAFLKQETVLTVAVLLAILSLVVVPPDAGYMEYIDWRTIGLLFGLMAVMAGFQQAGVFRFAGNRLLRQVRGQKGVMGILVFLCFFFSMFITNDVALITFVPFSLTVLQMAHREKDICLTVVLQTIAANLGSMLTPLGNPQNLYLYGKSGMSLGQFLWLMLPYTVVAAVFLLVLILGYGGARGEPSTSTNTHLQKVETPEGKSVVLYLILFAICLLAVAKVLATWIMVICVTAVMIVYDWKRLKEVDYSLLATFLAFFIFIGNMGRIPVFRDCLQQVLMGHECITAVVASQVVSNVPAALLLSGFTDRTSELIVGVNLGGLGTLIASMASLISYKFIAKEYPAEKGKYFRAFTLWNLVFLVVLLLVKYGLDQI
nr:anion permease [Eubacterium sp.]